MHKHTDKPPSLPVVKNMKNHMAVNPTNKTIPLEQLDLGEVTELALVIWSKLWRLESAVAVSFLWLVLPSLSLLSLLSSGFFLFNVSAKKKMNWIYTLGSHKLTHPLVFISLPNVICFAYIFNIINPSKKLQKKVVKVKCILNLNYLERVKKSIY